MNGLALREYPNDKLMITKVIGKTNSLSRLILYFFSFFILAVKAHESSEFV